MATLTRKGYAAKTIVLAVAVAVVILLFGYAVVSTISHMKPF